MADTHEQANGNDTGNDTGNGVHHLEHDDPQVVRNGFDQAPSEGYTLLSATQGPPPDDVELANGAPSTSSWSDDSGSDDDDTWRVLDMPPARTQVHIEHVDASNDQPSTSGMGAAAVHEPPPGTSSTQPPVHEPPPGTSSTQPPLLQQPQCEPPLLPPPTLEERGACMDMTDERRAAIIGAMKNISISYMPAWATRVSDEALTTSLVDRHAARQPHTRHAQNTSSAPANEDDAGDAHTKEGEGEGQGDGGAGV